HGGHGNASPQVYNHVIMPLASRRDKVTQVRWGIRDFQTRFGREPEGLWLPETAVDDETAEVLAEAGLKFTVLAPHQARRVRPLAGGDWQEVGDRVDPSRPYLWHGPRGLSLALFFYNAPISRAIAFEKLLERSENLVAWLLAAFADDRDEPQLVHCATDGESYGHHSRFGEMARASAHLKDPWAARDAYVDVVLDRSPDRLEAFLAAHRRAPLDAAACVETRKLLEMQRQRMLMHTSCGWFFDEISALEPVQVLRY